MRAIPASFYSGDVDRVARDLIGATLLVDGVGGVIVETEAYDAADPASHSFVGRTARNAAMFGPVGHAYIYRIYGLHLCLNIVCGSPGSAVLIRAIEPLHGVERMQERRGAAMRVNQLCAGPGRLCSALGIDQRLDGASMALPPFALFERVEPVSIQTGPRIGITLAADRLRRFGAAGSPWLSRRFPIASPCTAV
ncbi:DNA-3-methyladenine glycosylase [Sphingomonas sp.]|uniref:DNA-3-methyladenine glycosylase n=1 Tax=Sphingomonas sp. TaxID=28214 RepID=UPI0031DE8CB1